MAIQTVNSSDNPSIERVQYLLNQNIELEKKRQKASQARIPSDPDGWQRMRENFEAILLGDHVFSEQHDIECALWQLHYKRIVELRAIFSAAVASAGSNPSQSGKVPAQGGPDRVAKIRSQFKTFLTEATGFYHDLMLKIRAKYGPPLGSFSDDSEGQIPSSQDVSRSAEVKKGLISCHRCLIYLGDLARYKGLYGEGESKALDFATASSYYMQATSLLPSSGNPHHQLAILAAYSDDELVSIYRYFRSLAVDSPFTTASDNLIIAFEKNRQIYNQLAGDLKTSPTKFVSAPVTLKGKGKGDILFPTKGKWAEGCSVKDKSSHTSEVLKLFKIGFVRLNGILFTCTSLEVFWEVFSAVRSGFLQLLSSGPDDEYSFGPDDAVCRLTIVRLIAILIFTFHNVNKETENQSYAEILQRSVLLQSACTASFEFTGLILERCIQLNDPSSSYLLPGVMVFVEWLACHQDIAVGSDPDEKQASARLLFWNNYITFLNKIVSSGYMLVDEDGDEACFVNTSGYNESETASLLALPEDFELRGFLPLLPAQVILKFSRKMSYGSDGNNERKTRIRRITAAGKALANVVCLGDKIIYLDKKLKKFLIGVEPQISDDNFLTTSQTANVCAVNVENLIVGQLTPVVLQPKPLLCREVEEEDEVIVFKPHMAEKHVDRIVPKSPSADFPAVVVDDAKVNLSNFGGTFSSRVDAAANAFNMGLSQPVSITKINTVILQSLQPSSFAQMSERGNLVNGMASLNLWENGLFEKSENYAGALQPHPLPISLPQPAYIGNGFNYSLPVPSKFDVIMSEGVDSLLMKPSPLTAAGVKKNPIARPHRHLVPPPGFGSLHSKFAYEPVSSMSKTESTEISEVDAYSWFDGYRLPAVSRNAGFSSSFNHSQQPYHNFGKTVNTDANFPFPGKQVLALQPAMDNLKDCQDFQFSQQMKLFQEQVHQLHKGNQQSAIRSSQQHQGQSIWEGGPFG